jgi:ubiquinone/menaquinone biosynthesis C-methylase UbiE
MALACPIDLDVVRLRKEIESIYARVAEDPSGEFHFHRGAEYAASMLDYDAAELARLPRETTSSFAGVANPFAAGKPRAGETVVDIGSGAGTDALLAAWYVGPSGRVIGVDPTDQMLAKARASAAAIGATHVELRKGSGEQLPVETGSVDVVISNGVVNLAPDKALVFQEITRVLAPGGRLQLADIVVASELSEGIRNDIDLWTG